MVVRLDNNIVTEIIPDYALPVEKWFGEEFAAQCVEAPDYVTQNMWYYPEDGSFKEYIPEKEPYVPSPIEQLQKENLLLKAQMQFHTERADLLEGALVEIASMVVE